MWLRANVALAIAVVFAVAQMFASVTGGPRAGDFSALASSPNGGLTRSVAAQDDNDDEDSDNDDEDDGDNDDEDSDNDEDNDEDDSDNDDEDSDNDEDNDDEDSDNDDEDSDNDDEDAEDTEDELDEELDNVDTDSDVAATVPVETPTPSVAAAPPAMPGAASAGASSPSGSPVASPQPLTEAQLVTAGMDATLALQGDRVLVQVFSTMPAGITLKVRMVDPLTYPATPGIRAGDLIFQLEATDSMGMVLPTLPGEVNLSVRYTDVDVTGLDDTAITLARLDPFDSTWKTAPKLLTDPMTNYLAASVMDTGVYAVFVP